MIIIRKGHERGKTSLPWLDSSHSFSFADYHDPKFMGFRSLRVINEDFVQPEMGFGLHAHRDMEIISLVIEGSLTHKDSMGNGSTIEPGEIQCMSAGTGIQHSEFNHSATDILHFLQIWIIPDKIGLKPGYQQLQLPQTRNSLTLIAANIDKPGVIHVNQDVKIYLAHLDEQMSVSHLFEQERAGWLQVIKGIVLLNGLKLGAGDGAGITENMNITAITDSEFILFDLQ